MGIDKEDKGEFSEIQLLNIILDLFLAGAETTSTTLKWTVLFLTLYPEVQEKCRAEIEGVVGSKQPELSDMEKLVFCEATILEIQRLGCIVPSSLMHRVMEDTVVDGFFFPRNCIVISNLYYMMSSPSFWENPKEFKPERFISNGRRICMGDTLAKNELSILLTTMIQRLKFSVP